MRLCSINGCFRKYSAKDLCKIHYERQRKTGTTAEGRYAHLPFVHRLWRHIDRRAPKDCWPWTGSTATGGYGTIWRGDGSGKLIRAHRAVWEQFNGPIEDHPRPRDYHGWVVMHTCDNRACCNPAHLRLGTQARNLRDMGDKGRYRVPGLRGEANPTSRLTDDLVRLFRASPKTSTELAREHGCSLSAVSLIRRGKTWRHLL
jgi:HNH endonuclease